MLQITLEGSPDLLSGSVSISEGGKPTATGLPAVPTQVTRAQEAAGRTGVPLICCQQAMGMEV